MSVLFMDGFDHYATAQIGNKWNFNSGGTINAGSGRNGTNSLRTTHDNAYVERYLPSSYATLAAGFSFCHGGGNYAHHLISFFEDTNRHFGLLLDPDTGKLQAQRNTVTLATTAEPVIFAGQVAHIQVRVHIHDSAGTVELLINGIVVISLTGQDTRNGGTGVINKIRLQGISRKYNDWDDLWIDDADLLGDCRVEAILPDGAGDSAQWDASAGNNHECVDETPPNNDTDYVSSETTDEIDTYTFGNLVSTSGFVKGVQVSALHRKDDAGSRNIALVARPGTTDHVGASIACADDYVYGREVWDLNPDTGAEWTIAEINAAKFGMKMVS